MILACIHRTKLLIYLQLIISYRNSILIVKFSNKNQRLFKEWQKTCVLTLELQITKTKFGNYLSEFLNDPRVISIHVWQVDIGKPLPFRTTKSAKFTEVMGYE